MTDCLNDLWYFLNKSFVRTLIKVKLGQLGNLRILSPHLFGHRTPSQSIIQDSSGSRRVFVRIVSVWCLNAVTLEGQWLPNVDFSNVNTSALLYDFISASATAVTFLQMQI